MEQGPEITRGGWVAWRVVMGGGCWPGMSGLDLDGLRSSDKCCGGRDMCECGILACLCVCFHVCVCVPVCVCGICTCCVCVCVPMRMYVCVCLFVFFLDYFF